MLDESQPEHRVNNGNSSRGPAHYLRLVGATIDGKPYTGEPIEPIEPAEPTEQPDIDEVATLTYDPITLELLNVTHEVTFREQSEQET